MKQRYTLTIADMEINVISEESPETVESLVGNVDRKIREILVSSRRCSRGEAALLCALEYCSDKSKALRRVKQHEMTIYEKDTEIDRLRKEMDRISAEKDRLAAEKDRLQMEMETLRESILAVKASKAEELFAAPAVEAPNEEAQTAAAPNEEVQTAEAPVEVVEEEPSAAPIEAPVEEEPASFAPVTEETREAIAPEDVEFDPTEIFRRAKANRMIRKGQKKKTF